MIVTDNEFKCGIDRKKNELSESFYFFLSLALCSAFSWMAEVRADKV